jgi:Mn2+/Fe2+ NRAMP family transporter
VPYRRLAPILKWTTLTLFVYVAAAFSVQVPWAQVLHDLVVPQAAMSWAFWMMIVAILGTTISPCLFFWKPRKRSRRFACRA